MAATGVTLARRKAVLADSGHSVLEKDIERAVCNWAHEHAILAIKFTPDGSTGWPDRIFLYMGRVLFIEFKAPGKAERPLQRHRRQQLVAQGFTSEVIDNVEDGIKTLHTAFLSGSRD